MAFLFDTDAISELLRPRPLQPYVQWLKTIPRDAQFTSAVTVGELFKGAFRSAAKEHHLLNIEERVLPAFPTDPKPPTEPHPCRLSNGPLIPGFWNRPVPSAADNVQGLRTGTHCFA